MIEKEGFFLGGLADVLPGVLSTPENEHLRALAARWRDLCADAVDRNAALAELWRRHNGLQTMRPLILVFPEGSWNEIVPEQDLIIKDRFWRAYERYVTCEIHRAEHIHDDTIRQAEERVPRVIRDSGWGVVPERTYSESGMWREVARLHEPEAIETLQTMTWWVDRDRTRAHVDAVAEVFADLLPVTEWKVNEHPYPGIIPYVIRLRGLDALVVDMIERPEWVHRLTRFVQEATLAQMDLAEASIDMALNNGNHHVGTGGIGYTDELPAPGRNGRVRYADQWGHAQSQDYTCISAAMFKEFALDYQRPVMERFGLSCFGCCERLDDEFDAVKKIRNLHRVSVSPFTDVEKATETLGDRYVFSWKLDPAQLVGGSDEERIAGYIRKTLEVTRGCRVEMILKDTDTCQGRPERFGKWLAVARRACDEAAV